MPAALKFEHRPACEHIARRFASSYGWDQELSMQIAEAAIESIRDLYGGNQLYIQKRNGEAREKVRAEFNGRNIVELSRKYAVSANTIRNYLKNTKN